MNIFNLIDHSFSHHVGVGLPDYSVAGNSSEIIKWDRTLSDKKKPIFFSNEKVLEVKKYPKNEYKNYGFVFESQAIIAPIYEELNSLSSNFEKIFTHSSKLLKSLDNALWIPGGGCWVGGSYAGGERKIFPKDKLCSMVTSPKQLCQMHTKRVEIANFLQQNSEVDVFGLGEDKSIQSFKATERYMFSVAVENYIDELYFTEKILNCFCTGTIPIYFGATEIDKKFNSEGILKFSSISELQKILLKLTPDYYYSKIPAVKENFEKSFEFITIEDYIYKNYQNLFL